MNVTKNQIIQGVVKYAKGEVLPKVAGDKPFQMTISTLVALLEMNPAIADTLLLNPMVMAIMGENNGYYNLDHLEKALNQSMSQYGELQITIPGIPFVSPKEKVMTFTQNDITRLRDYIGG
jgi:hypothetical protein